MPVMPQLYLCATCWSSLAFYPYVYHWSASPFHIRLLQQLPQSQCLADTVSFCIGITHPSCLLPLWVMPGPYAFLLRLRSHTLVLPPFQYLPPFFLARVSQFLSDSYKLSLYRVITLLRFSQLISKTLTHLVTVRWLDLYVLVYKPVVKIIVASDLISFVNLGP